MDAASVISLWLIAGLITDGMFSLLKVVKFRGDGRHSLNKLSFVSALASGVLGASFIDYLLAMTFWVLPHDPMNEFAIHCPSVAFHCHPVTDFLGLPMILIALALAMIYLRVLHGFPLVMFSRRHCNDDPSICGQFQHKCVIHNEESIHFRFSKMTERYGTSLAKLLPTIVSGESWNFKADLIYRHKNNRIIHFE